KRNGMQKLPKTPFASHPLVIRNESASYQRQLLPTLPPFTPSRKPWTEAPHYAISSSSPPSLSVPCVTWLLTLAFLPTSNPAPFSPSTNSSSSPPTTRPSVSTS